MRRDLVRRRLARFDSEDNPPRWLPPNVSLYVGGLAHVGELFMAAFYMATLGATRSNLVILMLYQLLCQVGKAKELALTACMRKLLTILNAMLKSGSRGG